MSVFKRRNKVVTILDFSDSKKLSKYCIRKALSQAEVKYCSNNIDGWVTFFNNEIRVGMYTIRLELNSNPLENFNRLKQYTRVRADVVQQSDVIDLESDSRFSYMSLNTHCISINDLTNLIYQCKKLHELRAFL